MVVRVLPGIGRNRWLTASLALVLVTALLPATDLPHQPHAFGTPVAMNGPQPPAARSRGSRPCRPSSRRSSRTVFTSV